MPSAKVIIKNTMFCNEGNNILRLLLQTIFVRLLLILLMTFTSFTVISTLELKSQIKINNNQRQIKCYHLFDCRQKL